MSNVPDISTVLALSRDQHHHFSPLYNQLSFEVVESADWDPEIIHELQADLLLTPSCDWYEAAACIEEARRLKIPSLYLMDGIIEWRHQWENPKFGAGGGIPYNQPVTTDKVACLGWQSARTLEAWGNIGKCEIVGAPRFDPYLRKPVVREEHEGPRRLLVMTANTPGFTAKQLEKVERSLVDVKTYLEKKPEWEPIWRVRRGLDEKLGLTDKFSHLREQSLKEILSQADAVLTTPSTVLLESMLAGLPTAILDYTNSPQYVTAAWSVTAQTHLASTLRELHDPPARRLALQDEILHNCLACHTLATFRLVNLIEEMIEIGKASRRSGSEMKFPARMIALEFGGHAIPSEHFDFAELYPDHPIFSKKDLHMLQRELTFAQQELETLRREVCQRKIGYWMKIAGNKISRIMRGA